MSNIAQIRSLVDASITTMQQIGAKDPSTVTSEENQQLQIAEDNMSLAAMLSIASVAESLEAISRQLHAISQKP
jgi:hypothetical protein